MKTTKILSLTSLLVLALTFSARAESSVKLSNLHLCCKSCVTGVEKAGAKVSGAKIAVDKDSESATISAADAATVQKAVDAIVNAGYFGTSSDAAIKVKDTSHAKDGKVQSVKVTGVHLCCAKCATAANKAASSVAGVKSSNAEKGSKEFEVTGDFNAKEVFAALQKAGLAGKMGK